MKTAVIGNNKGGVGKTFLTKTLGEYAARQGLRTWLIDLDPQCNLSRRFVDMRMSKDGQFDYEPPIHPEYDNDPAWTGYSDSADIWVGEGVLPYPTKEENLWILPGHAAKLSNIELVRRNDVQKKVIDHLIAFLHDEELTCDYDLCLIDTRPSKGPLVQAALHAADKLIIPTEFAAPSIEGLHGMLALQRAVNLDRPKDQTALEIAAIVGNKVKANLSLHKEFREKLERDPVINPFLIGESFSDWGDYQKSLVFGAPSIFDFVGLKAAEQAKSTCEAILNRVMN